LLLVEEKADGDIDGAVADILNKFGWIPNFRSLPFFVAIAICFTHVRVLALRRDGHTQVLFDGGCGTIEDRLLFLRPAFNIARVVKFFVVNSLFTPIVLCMNQWHTRQGGKKLRLNFRGAEVQCRDEVVYGNLIQFYDRCANANVPFLERKIDQSRENLRIHLSPLGLAVLPSNMHEFCSAIECVIKAVHGMHSIGYFHTDIRWPNIVRVDNHWVVIDCYYVCHSGDHTMRMQRATERHRTDVAEWGVRQDIDQILQLFQVLFPTANAPPQIPMENVGLFARIMQCLQRIPSLKDLRRILQCLPAH
jgi:hypothetical protein